MKPGKVVGVLHAAFIGHRPDVVSVVERDGAALLHVEHGLDVNGHRLDRPLSVFLRIRCAGVRRRLRASSRAECSRSTDRERWSGPSRSPVSSRGEPSPAEYRRSFRRARRRARAVRRAPPTRGPRLHRDWSSCGRDIRYRCAAGFARDRLTIRNAAPFRVAASGCAPPMPPSRRSGGSCLQASC